MAQSTATVHLKLDATEFERDLQGLRRRAQRLAVPRWCRRRTIRGLVLASALAFPVAMVLQVLR